MGFSIMELGNDIFNLHKTFQDDTSNNFLKMVILNTGRFFMYSISEGGYHHPLLALPQGRSYDHTFFLNDRKGWGNDYLNPLPREIRCFSTVS